MSYGGDYTRVDGFSQSQCDGEIQAKDKIGFWCDYGHGDGAVLMIGGGGSPCNRTGHGIGITGAKKAKFGPAQDAENKSEYDFANEAKGVPPTNLYSLNLWVRQ